ncbi:DUF3954 domain-containing protein [Cytobacillus oceanisediminis]|uniref:DUF3954 domain-containing protein n=1 Tax=Cytobacillus oceanisediminis TaxID=665099 RepID=UPI00338E5422
MVKTNIENMTAEIDLMKNCLYVVKDGQITAVSAPVSGYGEYTAIWKDGKVLDILKNERVRLMGQEAI